jgi:sterol desaturase/sphingolipid hydroxylase (fatty acid hydroxylase superfamily)
VDALTYVIGLIGYQLLRVLNPREGYCLAYLVGGLLFAALVMLWRRRRRRRIRGLTRLFGSQRLWTHASTQLDLKLYLLNGVLILTAYGLFELSSEAWRDGAHGALALLFGASPPLPAPRWLAGGVTTGVQILTLELGYWSLHYAFHKVPALWTIHRVHHSAEVMTPLTEWRQHPIEFITFANVLTLAMGASYGAMSWLFGPGAEPFILFQLNIVLVLHLLTFHHLRHSGVWIAATGWLGRLVHSPAHHQIHHSADPRHFDRNLGYALSIWDWVFGTLWVPERRGRVSLGCDEMAHTSLADALVRPAKSWLGLIRIPQFGLVRPRGG